jgi:hypothetical protein
MKRYIKPVLKILFLVLILTGMWLLGISYERSNSHDEVFVEQNTPALLESEFVEYQAYQQKLTEEYPYYEPDGVTYKETIFNLFETKKQELELLLIQTQEDIPELIEWEREDGSTFMQAPTNFEIREDFERIYKIFPEYSNSICRLREEVWHGGSGSELGVIMCELYEYDKLIALMKDQLGD